MTALAPDALAGLDVGYAGTTMRPLAGGLAELGSRIVAADAPVDLLLVPAHGEPASTGHGATSLDGGPTPDGSGLPPTDSSALQADSGNALLDTAADGALAIALTTAFAAARDGASHVRPGGCLLFVLSPADDPARAAVASLTRTLALEWAPDLRVNALTCADPAEVVDLAALVAWPASRTLTGAVFDAAPTGWGQ